MDTTRNLTSGEQSENGLVSRSEYARLRVDLETAHGVVEDRGHDCDVEVVIHAEVGVLEELLAERVLLRLRLLGLNLKVFSRVAVGIPISFARS